jgi:hypothetical protein
MGGGEVHIQNYCLQGISRNVHWKALTDVSEESSACILGVEK